MQTCLDEWFTQYEQQVRILEHCIWENPEIAMEEFYACETDCKFFKNARAGTRMFFAING